MKMSGLRVGGVLCAVVLLAGAWATPAAADEGHESWWPEIEATPSAEVHDEDAHETDSHDDHGTTDDHGTAEPVDRPLPLVLGAFGTLNGAVLLFAAVTRRRERAEREARQAQRTQRRSVPATARQEEP